MEASKNELVVLIQLTVVIGLIFVIGGLVSYLANLIRDRIKGKTIKDLYDGKERKNGQHKGGARGKF